MTNREIKFRGKRIDNGQWVYGYYVKHLPYTPAPLFSDRKKYDEQIQKDTKHFIAKAGFSDWCMPREIELIEIDVNTLGEYIGIKDKNDKDIYEEDIVKHVGVKTQRLVRFEFGTFIVGKHSGSSTKATPMLLCKRDEVIGNIHDNPELLINK